MRHGGVSRGPFVSLNVGGSTGDDPSDIQQNRERIKKHLQIPELISSRQVHGAAVTQVFPGDEVDESDALVTNQLHLGLLIKHADCQAAIIYDPVLHIVANVHCGWRGNVKNIYANTVDFLRTRFGAKPENLLACISPSLGPNNAEFKNYRRELPEHFWDYQVKPTYFDLWQVTRVQLQSLGLLTHHIEIASMCTYAQSEDFFSYRRDKVTGRHATVVMLTT